MADNDWHSILPRLLAAGQVPSTDVAHMKALTGGVSSDIVQLTTADGAAYCAKRALPQLKVNADWYVPIERNRHETAWLKTANNIVPGCAPRVISADAELGVVLLEFLPPDTHVVWKSELLAGNIVADCGHHVGDVAGQIHAATLMQPNIAEQFNTDALFDAIRLDPYLRHTASVHPDLSSHILDVLEQTATHKIALVHGDLSPKNLLINISTKQPTILDAECAWFGDPAFDAAFCLNHFLLKSIKCRERQQDFMTLANAFFNAWIKHFEQPQQLKLNARTSRLLPCLLLARIDGKSPVEYLDNAMQDKARRIARQLIQSEVHQAHPLLEQFAALNAGSVS